ncbi:hypothetical protein TIFTF001_020087 [Ficus carica]|uniref:B-like cyclin n=1 Tax=Ficus carica TaxID=3494 RepID=A0AA88ATN5_FICCA|nr:hypothetical protein TIFTF001_020087 [Ficus carica]
MEFDPADSLTGFQEHQSDDVSDLFNSEADHMPSRNFVFHSEKRDFFASFRAEAISLVLQTQFSCNFDPFISYLAVNYTDRFVSKHEIPQGKPWFSRLIVISCLSLAAKMKNFPFSLSDIQSEEGLIFDAHTVHKMELLVLDTLSWRMRSITPFSFFSFFMSFFELSDPPSMQALKDRASEFIFTSQNDVKFLEFRPSIIAASALLFASHELFPLQFPNFKASLSNCQYVKFENLLTCFNLMQEMVAMMQGYISNLDTLSSTRTPVSVLERKFTNSESEISTTTGSTAECDTSISEKEENKRRKLNRPCSTDSRFKTSRSVRNFNRKALTVHGRNSCSCSCRSPRVSLPRYDIDYRASSGSAAAQLKRIEISWIEGSNGAPVSPINPGVPKLRELVLEVLSSISPCWP